MEIVTFVKDMQNICDQVRRDGREIRFVPTMGALHMGHASLIKRARHDRIDTNTADIDSAADLGDSRSKLKLGEAEKSPVVIVSIFVNPRQFNNSTDFATYPKDWYADLDICRQTGVDLVFSPSTEEMYCKDAHDQCSIRPPANLANVLEGRSRPGHFEGMLTIVNKLFNIIRPHSAYFGEKDYQQLMLVSKMVEDLNLGTDIFPVGTVREHDLLPLSSRNVRLSASQRRSAPLMCKILRDAKHALESESPNKNEIDLTIMASMLATTTISLVIDTFELIEVDYLDLRCSRDFSSVSYKPGCGFFDCQEDCVKRQLGICNDLVIKTRLLISIVIGEVRLLDNIEVKLNQREVIRQLRSSASTALY